VFRFLQFSDLHLDSNLNGSRLHYGPEKVRQRVQELRDALARICRLAGDENVDAVLVPGDLMDDEACSLDTVNFIKECFAGIAPIPVVITPGNHDFYSSSSYYNSDLLVAQRQTPWPDNVHLFTNDNFSVFSLPNRPDVSITGICHVQNRDAGDRLLASPLPKGEGQFHILLFHGSRLQFTPPGKKTTLPFTDAELIAQDFHYAAVGHYHTAMEVHDAHQRIRGAYSGCPVGRTLGESGPRVVFIGTLDEQGHVTLEQRIVDRRVIHECDLDCTGAQSHEAVQAKIVAMVSEQNVQPEDILYVRLKGRVPSGTSVNLQDDFLETPLFHCHIDKSNLLPDYDLDALLDAGGDHATTEARFVLAMQERLEKAVDDQERRVTTDALYYGLDALHQTNVTPRHDH
jgi:DNA repair protein SbcD/Mre11